MGVFSPAQKSTGGRSVRSAPAAAALLVFGLLHLPRPAGGEPSLSLPAGGYGGSSFGSHLGEMLRRDGFDAETVDSLLADPRGEVLRTTLAYAIVYRESKADYSRFLDEDRLGRAREFLHRKDDVLTRAEEKYAVPAEIIASILMIESDFGNFRRLHRTLNVFATLLWSSLPENFEVVREVVTARLPDVDDGNLRSRSRKKADWGYEQMKVLLRIAEREGVDPFRIEGSWAGAFGLPQFIPTSYWDYAVDGDGDGRVDLYNEDDAIFSIGNYLATFGWGEEISAEKQKAVLRRYNNSGLYVDTVLAAARQLR